MNTPAYSIDINADLGEGIGPDSEVMPLISSCNIACGGHAGDSVSMKKTIRLAQQHQVAIGAHPSFPDRDNFGRVILQMSRPQLTQTIYQQIMEFYSVCNELNATLEHIKLHGALYNHSAKDEATADSVIQAFEQTGLKPKLYVPHNSVLHHKAEPSFPLEFEAFIDRRYQADGSLRSRQYADAIIHDPQQAWEQLEGMVKRQEVTTAQGGLIKMKASTYCIHSDHPNALDILRFIREQMAHHHINLKS